MIGDVLMSYEYEYYFVHYCSSFVCIYVVMAMEMENMKIGRFHICDVES